MNVTAPVGVRLAVDVPVPAATQAVKCSCADAKVNGTLNVYGSAFASFDMAGLPNCTFSWGM